MTETTERSVSTPLDIADATITDNFWAPRIRTVREKTIPYQYHQLETVGHLKALQHIQEEGDPVPHIFWDSDIAKWIEAASYSLTTFHDAVLDTQLDGVIELLAAAQQPDGYLNTYFTLVEPRGRWTDLRDAHELYCAGHLIEAGVAHHRATGKTSLLNIVMKYADYISTIFGREPGQIRGYDGHEEIELALVKLFHTTGEQRYLDLASYFVEERGQKPLFFDLEAQQRGTPGWFGDHFAGVNHPGRRPEYQQAHAPVREQHEAVGHSVRAMYLYSAMADLAREKKDETLLDACRRLWTHLTSRRMYVTGGIGSSAVNEGFTEDFDLPDETAYAETCAAIGVMMWAQRLLRIDRRRDYGDVMERALYNGVLAGVDASGTRFFYDNPLASRGGVERHDWFEVACCPPNLARLLTSLASYAYAVAPDELIMHLFISGSVRLPLTDGTAAVIKVETQYPNNGKISLHLLDAAESAFAVAVRVPAWAGNPGVTINGIQAIPGQDPRVELGEDGYLVLKDRWESGTKIEITLDVTPQRVWADPRVIGTANRVAVTRGPLVYALEEVDNEAELQMVRLARETQLSDVRVQGLPEVVGICADGVHFDSSGSGLYRTTPPLPRPATLTFVPYYTWANRGAGEMRIWVSE